MASSANPERFHAMDALRAFMMLFGIFVHAGTLTTTVAGMNAVQNVSMLFRMEGFFLLSGFLAAMSLAHASSASFERKRLPAVLVPFFVMLPTNAVVLALIGVYAAARPEAFPTIEVGVLPGPWHLHLWFLIVLAAFTVVAPALNAAARVGATVLARLGVPPVALALVLVLALTVMSRGVLNVAMAGIGGDPTYMVLAFFVYAPFYLVGALAWHHGGLRRALIAPSAGDALAWTVILSVAVVGVVSGPDGGPIRVLVEAAASLAIFGVLSFAFNRMFSARNAVVTFLSESAYTVYLLHYLCLWLVFAALGGVVESYWVLYWAGVVFAFAATLGAHAFVVRRSPVLRFLLNGRPLRRTAVAASSATPALARR